MTSKRARVLTASACASGLLAALLACSPALPACAVEDASSGPIPCRWDASTSGNGVGHSFTVTRNTAGQTVFTYDDGTSVVSK
jgi:hypothetical protein